MLSQSQLEILLNRSLTTSETENLVSYLDIAIDKLESLLCTKLRPFTGAKKYLMRRAYKTVFTDLYSQVTGITVDGVAVTDYEKRWFDDLNSDLYNSVVLETRNRTGKVLEITGVFGFTEESGDYPELPEDLALILAKLFALVSNKSNSRVQSKQVEDFRISYKDITLDDQFIEDYALVLTKYSQCNAIQVLSGGRRCSIW